MKKFPFPQWMSFVGGQLVKPNVPVCPVNPQTEFCNCPGLVRPNFGTDYFPPGQLVSKLDRKSGAMFTFFITKFYYLNLKGPKVFINMGTMGSLVTLKYTCALFIHLRFPMKLRRIWHWFLLERGRYSASSCGSGRWPSSGSVTSSRSRWTWRWKCW